MVACRKDGVYMWLPGKTVRYFIVEKKERKKRKPTELGVGDPGCSSGSATNDIQFLGKPFKLLELQITPMKNRFYSFTGIFLRFN